jgi:hypothetical protein
VLLFQMNDVICDRDISGQNHFRQFVDSDELVSVEISCYGVRSKHYGLEYPKTVYQCGMRLHKEMRVSSNFMVRYRNVACRFCTMAL